LHAVQGHHAQKPVGLHAPRCHHSLEPATETEAMNAQTPTAQASIDEALRTRRTVRAFLPDPVPREQVAEILRLAACAPSNSNTQPWRVWVLAGEPKRRFSAALMQSHAADAVPPFAHFPDPLPEACQARQADFGRRYYAALGIDRADTAARARQSARNLVFFDAPVGLIVTIDARLKEHSWLDCGLFVQNLLIAAHAHGLATCPQVTFARYQPVIAQQLGLGEHDRVVCGVSLGRADDGAAVNRMDMPRDDWEAFTTMRGL
jgi:nitroreductase